METRFNTLLKNWPENSRLLQWRRPVLILSKKGLDPNQLEALCKEFILTSDQLLSVIVSLKMMHIYFRLKSQTYDYRPHRGPFSRISISDYHFGNSDRAEVLLNLTSPELSRFLDYVGYIRKSPTKVLGKSYSLSIREPNFTVYSHETNGLLTDNRLQNGKDKHNCLTWFTTAPLGDQGESVLSLLEMESSHLAKEAHSYVVEFFRFLICSADARRVPGLVFWTSDSINGAVEKIREQPDFLLDLHTKRELNL